MTPRFWFVLRLATSLVLVAGAVLGVREGLRKVRGQVMLGIGVQRSREPAHRQQGLIDLRTAHRINPSDPDAAWWLGYYTFHEESERANRNPGSISIEALNQSLALFQQAVTTHERPAGVYRQGGDVMNLIANFFVLNGQVDKALEHARSAANQYALHDELLARPWGDEPEHYTSALPRALQGGRPDLAAAWFKQMERHGVSIRGAGRIPAHLSAAHAWFQIGLPDAGLALLARMALEPGSDRAVLREFTKWATQLNKRPLAIALFERLDAEGRLSTIEQAVLSELRRMEREADPQAGWLMPE